MSCISAWSCGWWQCIPNVMILFMWQGAGEGDAERRSPYIPHNSNYYNELLHYSPLHWTLITKTKNCRARELERMCCFSLHPVPNAGSGDEVCGAPLSHLLLNHQCSGWRGKVSAGTEAELDPSQCEGHPPAEGSPDPALGSCAGHSSCLYSLMPDFAKLWRTWNVKNTHFI